MQSGLLNVISQSKTHVSRRSRAKAEGAVDIGSSDVLDGVVFMDALTGKTLENC